jgi:hypothetical protein
MSLRDSNADPREYAAHCLSAFLSHAYEGTEISGTGEIERAVNLSPNTLAGNYWITRIKRNLPGSQQRDWELALETFVNACLSHYGKPELQDRAAA